MANLVEKTCTKCGATNLEAADACAVCGYTEFRPSATHPAPERDVLVVVVEKPTE